MTDHGTIHDFEPFEPEDRDELDSCHHGIGFDEECDECDEEDDNEVAR